MRYFQDIWYTGFFDRSAERFSAGMNLSSRIRELTQRLLDTEPNPLPESARREMEQIASHWQGDYL